MSDKYDEALEMVKDAQKLLGITKELIESAQKDVNSVRTQQLALIRNGYERYLQLKHKLYTPDDIIKGRI